jgi:hypothetical protein
MDDHGLEGVTESLRVPARSEDGWAALCGPGRLLQPGDHYTIAGVYRPRTWWEWLTLAPRPLQVWYVRKAQR